MYIISNAVSFSEVGWGADHYRILFLDPIQLCHVLRFELGLNRFFVLLHHITTYLINALLTHTL
ncbi:hypothetical protein [Methanosarcina sp. 1.H.A.2.2]|uniref:hypothetical protein n=1 Tax=Methanosarcina sp. 1.H.A.2.2 TaxID=1483601 RepID=UPI001F298AB8|nr:hypothetical protein [Methanosarcina sp. 1.H.A.2.2]